MSYYEPSSLYGLGPGDLGELREKTRWDSGVHVDGDYWSLLGPCQDCKIAIPELKQKLEAVKQEKLYLEAQKGFLHAQLESAASVSAQLQGELREKDVEITGLRARVTRLETEVSQKPAPPPPPPPLPPKSLFTHMKNSIIRKNKRAASVPNINTLSAPAPAPPMRLNTETLEAIRNRRYQLRPVRPTAPFSHKTRRLSGSELYSEVNLGGFGDIGAILARRINMGYSTIEEDCVSVKSYSSVRSGGSLESIEWKATEKCLTNPDLLYVTVLQIDN